MNFKALQKIADQIRWDATPASQATGIDNVSIATKEDFEQIKRTLAHRSGYYFYIDVWNCNATLCIAHDTADGKTVSEPVEVSIPDNLLDVAVYAQGGAINLSGWYAINDEIRHYLQLLLGVIRPPPRIYASTTIRPSGATLVEMPKRKKHRDRFPPGTDAVVTHADDPSIRVHAIVWGDDRWFLTIPKRHKYHDQFPTGTDVVITLSRE